MNIYFSENNPNIFVLISEEKNRLILKMRTLSLGENKQ